MLVAGPGRPADSVAAPWLELDQREARTGVTLRVTGAGCFLPDGVTGADGVLLQFINPNGTQAAAGTIEVERDGAWDAPFVVPGDLAVGTYSVQGRCIAPMYDDLGVVEGGSFTVTGIGPPAAVTAEATPQSLAQIESYPAYDGQSTCSPSAKPGMVGFRDMVMAAYPGSGSYGISRDCAIGGTSEHKEGRAWDWANNANDPAGRARVDQFIQWLFATDQYGHRHAMARRLGVMYVIWNRQIFRMYRPDEGWTPYTGSSPHTDHAHISLTRAGGAGTTSFWTLGLPGPGQTGPGGFTDVGDGAWFADALEWGVGDEIVNGFADGTFRGDASVNRAQSVTWLWALAGRPAPTTRASFTDVAENAWFADALSWAVERGIIGGYADGTFRATKATTRSQLAGMFWKYAGQPAPRGVAPYSDVTSTSWNATAIAWMAERSYANGWADGTFRAGTRLTRAQGVTWLYAIRQFTDVQRGSWLERDVDWARYRGIVAGFEDHSFRPGQPSNRLDTVRVLWEAMDAPSPGGPHPFTDVAAEESALSWAHAGEIVSGYGDGTFRPNKALNRAQAIVMLWKVAGQPASTATPTFTDVPENAWYRGALGWAVEHGIVSGFSDGTFRATDPVTRGQLTVQVGTLAHTETAWSPAAAKPSTVAFGH